MKSNQNFEVSDAQLSSPSQQAVQNLVHAIPEESLSMAWRSSLNERLIMESASYSRRKRVMWIRMPAFGLAAACALATVFMVMPSMHSAPMHSAPAVQSVQGGAVEEGLLATYSQESASRAIEGAGPDLSAESAKSNVPDLASVGNDWTEADEESL